MVKKLRNNPLPRHAHIEISGGCQLECPYCSAELRASKRGKMTAEVFKGVLNKIPTLKSVTLTLMNEPLLNNEITDLVLEAKRRGIHVGFPTNGVTFPKKLQSSLLKAGLDSIAFSIDTLDPVLFKKIRFPGDLEVVLDNLRSFIEMKNEMKAHTKVSVVAVLNEEVLKNLESFIQKNLEYGVDSVQFRFPHSWTEHGDETVEYISIEKALEALKQAKQMYGRKIGYYHHPNHLSKVMCPRPFNTTAIKVDGDVVPCCLQASDPRQQNLGNVYDQSFQAIWDGDAYVDFRKPFLDGKWPSACEGCTVLSGLNDNPGQGAVTYMMTSMISILVGKENKNEKLLSFFQKYPF